MSYWLMKSEPEVYSIEDLEKEQQTIWDGVRNYQARNFLRRMQVGDLAFFYHSNSKPSGIVGLMTAIETNLLDPTQFDRHSKYYDPKSTVNAPRWQTVKLQFLKKFPEIIALEKLKQLFAETELLLVKKGNRLSIMPVSDEIAEKIVLIGMNPLSC
jgi:predicted RNA-binding protein with PUA-like domain